MLEVIGVGFGRTGTLSLKVALERLGFGPCHHMLALFDDPGQIALWKRAARGEAVDWTEVYRNYRSTVDWPGARFWRQIADAFPAAKVVLTVRDPESWYDSAHRSIYETAMAPLPESGVDPVYAALREMSHEVVWDGVFGGRFADRDHAIRTFTEHNEAVRRALPAERLLVFRASQGWEPLCGFLGVEVPDEPFPRRNDREAFAEFIEARRAGGVDVAQRSS
ncbi:sulfotransferase family protein [Actinomadura keratinilytica]|jgi:hypothetical protein|uniref:Sulfotransferase family protein n=1 Tax=Actinomadura keratinilytica TaxID=547461 RepID=A0ABP7YPS2_9ACTN